MRCRFASPDDSSEQRALAAFDASCHDFFHGLTQAAGRAELEALLAEVDADFEFLELTKSLGVTRVDVRGPVETRPRLSRFVSLAPGAVLVVPERGPRGFLEASRCVAETTGVDVRRARVRAGITRGHLLELVVYLPCAKGRLPSEAEAVAELAVEACVGERCADDWINGIDVLPLLGAGPLKVIADAGEEPQTFPLCELPAVLDSTVRSIRAELPERPLCELPGQRDWVMLEADTHSEVGLARQADLVLASTCLPEMLKCYLEEAPFASLRFSRHAERFAYIKYPDALKPSDRAKQRQALEDALDQALREQGLGAVVGNGVGRRHSYIDLALLDVEAALPVLRSVAQGRGLPTESWLLFCDSEWQLEWVGLWPETKAPAL